MPNISIVTAFFDIGRGDWSASKGYPSYLQRTTDTYFERFSNLAELENEMVVFTSDEFVDRIMQIRKEKKTTVITLDYKKEFSGILSIINKIQEDVNYQNLISPQQIKNPEYWNADYILINALKSFFVRTAIVKEYVNNELVAWVDFGYCRNKETLINKQWSYNFDPEKINVWSIKDCDNIDLDKSIINIIANNDVHITGPCIVTGKKMWPILEEMVNHNLIQLLNYNLVDDDQTLLLMSYVQNPDLFKIRKIEDDWFIVFKEYNDSLS